MIKSTDLMTDFLNVLNKRYERLEKIKPLFEHKAAQNTLDENLTLCQAWHSEVKKKAFTKKEIETELRSLHAKHSPDMPFEDYVKGKAAMALWADSSKKHFINPVDSQFTDGYCTTILMQALNRLKKDNPLQTLLGKNPSLQSNPKELVKYLQKAAPDCIYQTDDTHNIENVLNEQNVGAGALVILDLEKGSGNPSSDANAHLHTIVYTGRDKQSQAPEHLSFNDERIHHQLHHRQCGFIIDLQKIMMRSGLSKEVQKDYGVPTEAPTIPKQTNADLSVALANKGKGTGK